MHHLDELDIDWDYLKSLDFSQSVWTKLQSIENYDQFSLKGFLIKARSDQRLRVIKEIKCLMNPQSPFPNRSLARTFSEYFENHRSLMTTSNEQPLVEAEFLNLNQNFILRSNDYQVAKQKKLTKLEFIYIAEHLSFIPFTEKEAFCLFMIPSIFYRVNHLLKTRKLKLIIENEMLNNLNIQKVYFFQIRFEYLKAHQVTIFFYR